MRKDMDRIDEFLKSLLDKTKEESDLLREKEHDCPSEETVACYIDNLLKDDEKDNFEEHLAECDDCLKETKMLHDFKKEVGQSGYIAVPAEATERARNIVPENYAKSLYKLINESIEDMIKLKDKVKNQDLKKGTAWRDLGWRTSYSFGSKTGFSDHTAFTNVTDVIESRKKISPWTKAALAKNLAKNIVPESPDLDKGMWWKSPETLTVDETKSLLASKKRLFYKLYLTKYLNPKERQFYKLHYVEKLSPKEIAGKMGRKVGTVYSYKSRTKKILEKFLKKGT